MGTLDGKVALVTGSGRGIGQAISLKLASEGASVVVNDLDAAPAQDTIDRINALGAQAASCVGNVTDEDFATRFVNTALETFGVPDIVVNNAGYTWDNVIQKMSVEQFQAVVDVHLVAPFRILKAAAEPMRAAAKQETERGEAVYRKVVNISSVSGVYGNVGQSNYAAGKLGVVGLTKTLAKEWGRYRICVNAVAYGLIHTRLTQPLDDSGAKIDIEGREIAVGVQRARLDSAEQRIPLGRGGSVEEAAGAVYLFCIPESDYVSGQLLVCDGGGR